MNLFSATTQIKPGKRILCILLAILLLTGLCWSVAPEVRAAESNDTATMTMVLNAVGVLSPNSSGSYNLSGSLTREQFAKMLVMASGYRDYVTTNAYSSPFKDVKSTDWSASYVKLAASYGLLSGYSDGKFRPTNSVTYEQGINSVLMLLGYDRTDFTGAFPYIQINIATSLDLLSGVEGSIGSALTKEDGARLIYNALTTQMKDSKTTLAEKLGYTINTNGEIDYASLVNESMKGPYIVESASWYTELGISEGAVVYKNGSQVTLADVSLYDVVYYSSSKGTVWVYNDRVTGVYDAAKPSQDLITSITLSGTSYNIESTSGYAALSSSGSLKVGDAVTLLLGKNGGVVGAVSIEDISSSTILYVTSVGNNTVKGITPYGQTVSYAVSSTSSYAVGDVLKVTFSNTGDIRIGKTIKSGGISGTASVSTMTIGTTGIASGTTILDTYEGSYTGTSMSRLDGLTISNSQVLYSETENGKLTCLILDNVTGDALQYGLVTEAISNLGSNSASGSYTYDLKGSSYTLNSANKALSVSEGPAMFYGKGSTITNMKNLSEVSGKVMEFSSGSVTASSLEYEISADVAVYHWEASGYTYEALGEAIDAYDNGKAVKFYYDKAPSSGGQIRVIIYQ